MRRGDRGRLPRLGLVVALALVGMPASAQDDQQPAPKEAEAESPPVEERQQEAAVLGKTGQEAIAEALGDADAGPPALMDQDAGPDAPPVDGGPGASAEREAEDQLAALIVKQASERQRAEELGEQAARARERALERARQAHNETLERLHTQLAACESAREAIARARTAVGDEVRASLEASTAALKAHGERRRAAGQAVEGADALLDEALAAQRVALDAARDAIRRRHAAPSERLEAELNALPDRAEIQLSQQLADQRTASEVAPLLKELDEALADIEGLVQALDREAAELRYRAAEAWLDVAVVANETRMVLMERASATRQRALHSLTEEGRDNVTVALEHVGTLISFHVLRRTHDMLMLPTRIADPIFSGRLVWALFKLALLALVVAFGLRRGRAVYPRLKAAALDAIDNSARRKLVSSVLALAEDAAPQAAALIIFLISLDVLQAIGPEPELSTVFGLLMWIWTYQLSAKLLHRLVLRLARRRHRLSVPIKLKILRTVRTALRFGFVAALTLQVTHAVVGAGVLYAVIRAGTVVAAALIFLILVSRWRVDIVEVYLAGWGETRLAQTIAAHRDRWFSLPLGVAALAAVAARGGALLARDFALGFEQTRKALAYLFQIRVERQAKERGQPAFNPDALPPACLEAFDDRPCVNQAWRVDRFGEQEAIIARIKDGRPLSLLVSAPAGGGLTTWLSHFKDQLGDVRVLDVTPAVRWHSAERVFKDIGAALGLEADEPSLQDLASAVRSVEGPLVFVVDELERAFMRRLGGYEPLNALASLMSETEFACSWIVGGRTHAVMFLDRVRGLGASFDRAIALPPWPEESVRELVLKRMRSCRVEVSFEDLLLQEVEATSEEARERQTEHAYLRLLWNVAEGSPRTVLHLWLRSLCPDGSGGLRVRLHDAPSPDVLEAIPLQERFLLHAVVLLRALSPAQMAVCCNQPVSRARAHVARGLEMGIYALDDDGLVTIQPHFAQAVLRFLRRKNLLH